MSTAPAPEGYYDNNTMLISEQPSVWVRHLHDEGPPLCLVRGRSEKREWIAEEWALIPGMPMPAGA